MSTPQVNPPGPNSTKGTTFIIVGLITLIVVTAIYGIVAMAGA
jgi:hypothetical protein